ncbi:hypothetical protein ACS0TY_027219 [Phlomoides rotata]
MTGKKVLQTSSKKKSDIAVEWEPVKEGLNVKLMTSDGKFLRANGGTSPWRNSITHDVPHRTATQSWVLWGVDIVDISLSDLDSNMDSLSQTSSFSSFADDFSGSPDTGSPMVQSNRHNNGRFGNMSIKQVYFIFGNLFVNLTDFLIRRRLENLLPRHFEQKRILCCG